MQDNIAYRLLTDCLGVTYHASKDAYGTVVIVLGLEIDTNLDKLARARQARKAALIRSSVTFKEILSLLGFLSFCAQAVHLGWVFMRQLWDFVADYPPSLSEFTRRRLSAEIRGDITW